MIRAIFNFSLILSLTTGCGKSTAGNNAKMASADSVTCPVSNNLNLVASKPAKTQAGEVQNPGYSTDPNARPGPNDYLPVVTTNSGEKIVGFPGGTTSDGKPVMKPETAVTGIDGYPYQTFQGDQPNCAPRAFEAITGVYNPYIESSINGNEKEVYVGGKTFVPQPNTVKPQVGQVVGYHPSMEQPGLHAGVVAGYDKDGNVIVATGWQSQPYQAISSDSINASYKEVPAH